MSQVKKLCLYLFLAVLLFSALICGTFNLDQSSRYQLTRNFTSNESSITPADIPLGYYLVGVNNTYYYPWNIGQSIFMVPGDVIATGLIKLVKLNNPETEQTVRNILVNEITFPLFSAATVLLAFLLLLEFNFSIPVSFVGALSLFFGTTFLSWTQNHQENSQITFLIICGYYFFTRWLKSNRWFYLILGASLLGILFIIRLTTLADVAGISVFVILVLKATSASNRDFFLRIVKYGAGLFIGFLPFIIIDRLFEFKRFGEWTSTYISIQTKQVQEGISNMNGAVDYGWPFLAPRLSNFTNILFSLEKSIFIYDPLLIVLPLTLIFTRFSPLLKQNLNLRKAYLIGGTVSLILYLIGYSNVTDWNGGAAWGSRYTSSPVHILCLLAVPLFLEAWPGLSAIKRGILLALCALSFFFQFLSVIFSYNLEAAQAENGCLNSSSFYLLQRIINLAKYLTGNLTSLDCVPEGESDTFVTPYFLPFRAGDFLPRTGQIIVILVWAGLVVGCIGFFIWLSVKLFKHKHKQNNKLPAAQLQGQ